MLTILPPFEGDGDNEGTVIRALHEAPIAWLYQAANDTQFGPDVRADIQAEINHRRMGNYGGVA